MSLFLADTVYGQYRVLEEHEIEHLAELTEQLPEVSGIIMTPYNTAIGHNDRGGKARLYEFDIKTGHKIRTIEIDHAKNRDWEDITSDAEYIYIGDFGNNRGRRERLKVYRIKWPEKGSERISVRAEKIRFTYADQTDFEKRKNHNYDCEAVISFGDSLYLFTKNRADGRTNVCALSKTPGEYVTTVTQTFDTDGLVTGADIFENGKLKMLSLIGYNKSDNTYMPFIWTFTKFNDADFFSGNAERVDLPMHIQTEGISFVKSKKILFTNEEGKDNPSSLYQVKTKSLIGQ
ncbi:MAG: hypothetical protein DRI69_08155 [Bacteroidetes bacterium]|nr:MAG: hypothetical protein DRI69_08155 [Bacteroidota bacterium]